MNRTAGWVFAGVLFALTTRGLAQSGRQNTVYTNRKRFAIPFQTDAAEIRRLGATEMRLFVSVDLGRKWQRVQSVRPNVRKFTVQAPRDGTYWFAVRTVDRDSRLHPREKISAELKVVVDTLPPKLTVKLSQPNPGRVELAWNAVDRYLDTASLLLEAKQPGGTKWQALQTAARAVGKTAWNVPRGGIVQVRGKIADSAGNTAVGQDTIRIAAGKRNVPRPKVPNFNDPIAQSNRGNGGVSLPPKFPTETDGNKSNSNEDALHPFGTTQRPSKSDLNVSRNDGDRSAKSPTISPRGGNKSIPRTPFPKVSDSRPAKPKVPTKLVNSREFRLNYKVERIGKSGVQDVVLYITQDGGAKWYRYGVDEDRESPMTVKVPDDGTYGFSLRVRSGVGLSSRPPQPGDAPEALITVDSAPPKLEMLPILQGQGKDSRKFLIRWRVTEDNPQERPISIAYARSADGPWKTISDWSDDAGKLIWSAPADVPAKVYVRITARDAAGNVSHVRTPRPVIIDDVKPRARITDVGER